MVRLLVFTSFLIFSITGFSQITQGGGCPNCRNLNQDTLNPGPKIDPKLIFFELMEARDKALTQKITKVWQSKVNSKIEFKNLSDVYTNLLYLYQAKAISLQPKTSCESCKKRKEQFDRVMTSEVKAALGEFIAIDGVQEYLAFKYKIKNADELIQNCKAMIDGSD